MSAAPVIMNSSPEQTQEPTTNPAPTLEPADIPLPSSPALSGPDDSSFPWDVDPVFGWSSSSSAPSIPRIDPWNPAHAHFFYRSPRSPLSPQYIRLPPSEVSSTATTEPVSTLESSAMTLVGPRELRERLERLVVRVTRLQVLMRR